MWAARRRVSRDAIINRGRTEKQWQLGRYRRNPLVKDGNELLEVRRPPVRYRGRADGVFEDQVPADDPREQFAERRVGVSVSRACDRHHRSELRIAERGEDARQPRQHEREHERRPRAVVRRDAGQDKDAGADDRAHAKRRQLCRAEDAAQAILALHLCEQQFEWFRSKQWTGHLEPPRILGTSFSILIASHSQHDVCRGPRNYCAPKSGGGGGGTSIAGVASIGTPTLRQMK